MKLTIKNLLVVTSFSILTSGLAMAEGDGNNNWAEEAAQKYEQKAADATANNLPEQAAIYTRMAQIKRDAGAAKGEFSWDEYHELSAKLNTLKGGDKKGKPNKGFVDAASKYDQKAAAAMAAGNEKDAAIYKQLADIKRLAAAGKLDNWDEYHALTKQLSGNKGDKKAHKKDHKKKHPHKHPKKDHGKNDKGKKSPSQAFLDAADEYEAKANEAMNNGNEHNARIYTRLANIKRDAAIALETGKSHDWTEYFKLKKELK